MENVIACQSELPAPEGVTHPDEALDGVLIGDRVDRLVAEAKAAALSANTRKAYMVGWRSWCLWASERGLALFPAAPRDLQRWLATLWDEGKKPSTLRTYRSAVAYWHRHHRGTNPARCPEVRQLLDGLSRRAAASGYAPRQAAPLRQCDVERIANAAVVPRRCRPGGRLETRSQAQQRATVDVAMISLAHDALLRCSELLALRWADIDLSESGSYGTVLIRRSKTDQTGQGAVVPISEFSYAALVRLKPAGAQPCDPVFDISPNTVTRRMRAAAQAAGIDPTWVSSHSPRVGMAQDLAAAGADMLVLMIAGRWKQATTVIRYTRHLSAQHTPVAQYLKTQQRSANEGSETKSLSELLSKLAAITSRLQPAAMQDAHQTRTQISDRRDCSSRCWWPTWPPTRRLPCRGPGCPPLLHRN